MTDTARREDKALALTPYLILGFILLLLSLALRAPASLLQKAVPASAPVRISAWGGTLWDGQAEFLFGGEPGFLSWRLQAGRLFTGHAAVVAHVQGALELDGNVELGPGSWRLQDMRGQVPVALFQSLLPPGWGLSGNVQADRVLLARQGFGKGAWLAAGGRLQWAGGPMQYNLGNQSQTATLPALTGTLQLDGQALVLNLTEQSGGLALAEIRLLPDGTLQTRLRERLLRYFNRTSGANPDAVVVTTAQKLK